MQQIRIGKSDLTGSRLAYGCMRIAGDGSREDSDRGKRAVRAALEAGYTVFDHADIYEGGACETLFGEVLRESPGVRQQIVIIGKCGIRFAGDPQPDSPTRYDFSARHLLASVDGSLARLGIDTLDLLLLHRPDYLMDVHAVAVTFDSLQSAGKVRYFGVSNFSASQFELLQSVLPVPLIVNQIEINLHNVEALMNGTLDQCQRLGVTPQAWCPIAGIAYPAWGNTFSADDEARIQAEVQRQAQKYRVDQSTIAFAWLLRHPGGIAPIVGSTTPQRIHDAVTALDVAYSRDDWYRLLEARNGAPVP